MFSSEFISTTTDQALVLELLGTRGTLFEIRTSCGRNISPLCPLSRQTEVLLLPNSAFSVVTAASATAEMASCESESDTVRTAQDASSRLSPAFDSDPLPSRSAACPPACRSSSCSRYRPGYCGRDQQKGGRMHAACDGRPTCPSAQALAPSGLSKHFPCMSRHLFCPGRLSARNDGPFGLLSDRGHFPGPGLNSLATPSLCLWLL